MLVHRPISKDTVPSHTNCPIMAGNVNAMAEAADIAMFAELVVFP
jgi:hypothetical protein